MQKSTNEIYNKDSEYEKMISYLSKEINDLQLHDNNLDNIIPQLDQTNQEMKDNFEIIEKPKNMKYLQIFLVT